MDTLTLFSKNLNQRSLTPRWPLTPCLFRSHVWLYPRIIVSKSHDDTSMYVDTVINFANYHIHTYTYYVHTTYILHTTYRMSDHIVSYWTQFRRDNYWTQFRRDNYWTQFRRDNYWTQFRRDKKRCQNSHTSLCNGVIFVNHTHRNKSKQNVSMIFVCRTAFHSYLSSRSDRSTYAPDKSWLLSSRDRP